MAGARHWSKAEVKALFDGLGAYGIVWFRARTNPRYSWPGAPKQRSPGAIYAKISREYGAGGLTRGANSLDEIVARTGYSPSQIRRAQSALAQKWKRTSLHGVHLISEEQLEDIIQWLQHDYWSKAHHLYNCTWCTTEKLAHYAGGLCRPCYDKFLRRCKRLRLPTAVRNLGFLVSRLDKDSTCATFLEELERWLDRGLVPAAPHLDAIQKWRQGS